MTRIHLKRKPDLFEALNSGVTSIDDIMKDAEKPFSAPSAELPMIKPGDIVLFKGKKATVQYVYDKTIVILQYGMTIECTKNQISLPENTQKLISPVMKFDKDTLKKIDESYVRCKVLFNGADILQEEAYVRFNDWYQKEGFCNVLVEDYEGEQTIEVPVNSVAIVDLPDEADTHEILNKEPSVDRFIEGAELNPDGQAVRQIKIDSVVYAASTNEDDEIPVLFSNGNSYEQGTLPKKLISALAV